MRVGRAGEGTVSQFSAPVCLLVRQPGSTARTLRAAGSRGPCAPPCLAPPLPLPQCSPPPHTVAPTGRRQTAGGALHWLPPYARTDQSEGTDRPPYPPHWGPCCVGRRTAVGVVEGWHCARLAAAQGTWWTRRAGVLPGWPPGMTCHLHHPHGTATVTAQRSLASGTWRTPRRQTRGSKDHLAQGAPLQRWGSPPRRHTRGRDCTPDGSE